MDDAAQIRGTATQIAAVAGDLRSYARRTASAQGVEWRGDAAAQYRKRLSANASALHHLARDVDSLAASLRRYARTVERRQLAVESFAGTVGGLVTTGAVAVARTVVDPTGGRR